jgi:periplasmic divalent cation tolerance protein
MKYCIIVTTCANLGEARAIAKLLLDTKLVACAQISKVESLYHWDGKIHNDDEYTISLKCLKNSFGKIQSSILLNSSYEVPQVLMIPVLEGFESYLKWIDKSCSG